MVAVKAPPSPLDRLIGLALASIEDATAAYLDGGDARAWRAAMGRAIATAHQAAQLTAQAERGAGGRLRGALARLVGADPQALMGRAEREALRDAVEAQLRYLDGFARDLPNLSPAQVAARAAMYGPAIRSFYYQERWGEWEIPDSLLPGRQQCLTNCKCRISVRDNGDGTGTLTREMGATEAHCTECPELAGEYQVRRRRR